jgi:hypothetical protein
VYKIDDAAVISGGVDHHLLRIRSKKIPNGSGDEIEILVNQRRGRSRLCSLLDSVPKYREKTVIPLYFPLA